MFLEHNAILQAHRTTPHHVAALLIGPVPLHYTACQLLHSAMLTAYSIAYILAENPSDELQEFRLALLRSHLDYLPPSHLQSQYDYIGRLIKELSR